MKAMSPRAAFFSAHEAVAAELAVGRISAELIAPYPPGIPVLAPGELVTERLLADLRAVAAHGVRVACTRSTRACRRSRSCGPEPKRAP